jgi:hypothetical protein
MAIPLSASVTVFASAMGSGHSADMILVQSMEQEVPSDQRTPQEETGSDQGTPHEEMGSGQGTPQDAGSTQSVCPDPANCPEQNKATVPDNNNDTPK